MMLYDSSIISYSVEICIKNHLRDLETVLNRDSEICLTLLSYKWQSVYEMCVQQIDSYTNSKIICSKYLS